MLEIIESLFVRCSTGSDNSTLHKKPVLLIFYSTFSHAASILQQTYHRASQGVKTRRSLILIHRRGFLKSRRKKLIGPGERLLYEIQEPKRIQGLMNLSNNIEIYRLELRTRELSSILHPGLTSLTVQEFYTEKENTRKEELFIQNLLVQKNLISLYLTAFTNSAALRKSLYRSSLSHDLVTLKLEGKGLAKHDAHSFCKSIVFIQTLRTLELKDQVKTRTERENILFLIRQKE